MSRTTTLPRSVPRACLFGLFVFAVQGCAGPPRDLPNAAELEQRAQSGITARAAQRERLVEHVLARMQREHEAALEGDAPVYDILVLSGGGQYGAFGAGVLLGWSELEQAELRRPEFDLVTGVSTGSLIAPFAFAGTNEELARVETFYQEVRADLAVLRGLLFFLPWRESFFDVTGLEQTLDDEVAQPELDALRAGHAEHRMVLVGTTDIDLGTLQIWDLGHQVQDLEDEASLRRLRRILRASSSIPAAFPPVEIDGVYHVDGGVAENLFLPTDVLEAVGEALLGHPAPPVARIRIWTIINGKLSAGAQGTSLHWPSIAGRSSTIVSHFATVAELRRLDLFCRWMTSAGPFEVEFRYIALPEEFEVPPTDMQKIFDSDLMGRLAELGESMGRDPASWSSQAPQPEHVAPATPE